MRDFGVLKGPDLVPILATLLQEGALAHPQVQVLKAVHQELRTHVELYYRSNVCVHAHSSDYAYRLEQLLYRKRLIERVQLDELQQLAKNRPDRAIAQLVLDKQWVSATELAQVVAHLTELISYEVLLWKETGFELSPNKRPEPEFFGTGLAEDQLMSVRYFSADGEKNLPVLVLMREKLGNPNTLLRRLKEVERSQLSDIQYHVYRYVNNRNSIRELLQLSDLGYFETFATLYQLLSWEYIGLGQLDVPNFARGHEAKSVRVEATAKPAPPQIKPKPAPVPAPADLDIPAQGKPGQRQFLRRGRGSELLQVLVSVMKSGYADGRVIVDNQQQIIRAEFSLFKGNLIHVATTAFNIRFGDLLVRRGILGPGQLREALEEQKADPSTHLGEILTRHGFVDEGEIPALVTHQMEAVIYEVLTWSDVKFYFDGEAATPQQEIYHKVSIKAPFEIQDGRLSRTDDAQEHNLLEDADQNLPILLTMRELLTSFKAIPRRTPRPLGVLTDEQSVVLKQVNGQHSLQEILLASPQPYFAALTALYQLVSTGALELSEVPEAAPRPATGPLTMPPRRNLVSPPQRQVPKTGPVEPSAVAVAEPELSMDVLAGPLIDAETQALIEQVPAARRAEVRAALQAVLRLAL